MSELSPDLLIEFGKLQQGVEQLTRSVTDMEVSSSQSRKDLYEKVESVNRTVAESNQRLANLEKSMSDAQPDLQKFRELRHQATGAGKMGKAVYFVGGGLVAAGTWVLSHFGGIIK